MQQDKNTPQNRPGEYSTDIVAKQTVEYIESAIAGNKPFFIGAAPIGPHSQTRLVNNSAVFEKPVPADRHKDLFPGLKVPRTPNFNPDTVCSPC